MKFFFTFSLFIFSYCLFAQQSLAVKRNDIYVYNNGKDTLHLTKMCSCKICFCDSLKMINTIQIDGLGSKEVVFLRHCSGFTSDHGGTFDIDESCDVSKYEIWNLDTKKMLFEVITSFRSDYNRFQAYAMPKHNKGKEAYSCTFNIDESGQITITNLKTRAEAYKVEWQTVKKNGKDESVVKETPYEYKLVPDKSEGIYIYVNGKYVKQ